MSNSSDLQFLVSKLLHGEWVGKGREEVENLVGSHPREHGGLDQTVATDMEVYREQQHLVGKSTRFGDGLN